MWAEEALKNQNIRGAHIAWMPKNKKMTSLGDQFQIDILL